PSSPGESPEEVKEEQRLTGARYAPAEPSWRERPMYGDQQRYRPRSGAAGFSPPKRDVVLKPAAPPQKPKQTESVNSVLSFFRDNEQPVQFDPNAIRPAARPSSDSGAAAMEYKRGSRVRHEQFGVGTILTMEGSGPDAKLTVYFDGVGSKKFVVRYAKLTRA